MVRYNGKKFSKREATGIASLLSQSLHPVADPIVKYLNIHPMIQVTDFKEITGNGIEGWLDEQHYKIGSAGFVNATDTGTGGTLVYVKIDREIYGHFVLQNQYRNGVAPMLDALKYNYKLYLLSGDRDSELQNLKKMFPEKSTILFKQTPEDKMEYIRELQKNGYKVLMIGDGLNDAGALKESLAGMAITDKNNVFTPSSDAILDGSALLRLNRLLCFIKSGRKIIFASFLVSAVYNFVGLYYAVQGSLSPLIAAILMPCSTITIVALTYGLSVLFARKSQLVYS
jgi:Cu+-exporting ATPase